MEDGLQTPNGRTMNEQAEWDEFEWEKALRESDAYAARYFELLERFCDLPGGNELIADRMGRDFEDRFPECDYDCESCESRFECDCPAAQEWTPGETDTSVDDRSDRYDDDDGLDDDDDPLFYETHPAFNMLKQTAMGWCNVYSAILPTDARRAGLVILFHIGRALANLAYSIGDGQFEQPASSIAFGKRSLAQLNEAVGLLSRLTGERPRLKGLLGVIREHLLKSRQVVLDHLDACRKRLDASA